MTKDTEKSIQIYIDADACPVKKETYKVATRYGFKVYVVCDAPIHIPLENPLIENITVPPGEDAADNWIAENIGENDICITADIPLADRCLKAGAYALGPRGREFTTDSIGEALATRELLSNLREAGLASGGPPPMNQKARSQYLNVLDQIIQRISRK